MEENLESQDTQPEVLEGEPKPQEGEEVLTTEQIADLKKKADVSSQNFERAKKAESEAKELREKLKQTGKGEGQSDSSFSTKDTIALVNAKINTEDFDTVVEWAAFKKIPVADALNDKVLRTAIREREEERLTASATSTKGGRSMTKDTPEEIVSRASKGILPDDDEGIAKLAEAQMNLRLKKLHH